jgi:hypothetical protein
MKKQPIITIGYVTDEQKRFLWNFIEHGKKAFEMQSKSAAPARPKPVKRN